MQLTPATFLSCDNGEYLNVLLDSGEQVRVYLLNKSVPLPMSGASIMLPLEWRGPSFCFSDWDPRGKDLV